MTKTLIALDIDQTICDSREIDHLLPARGSSAAATAEAYHAWHAAIFTTDFPVVKGCFKTLRDVAKEDGVKIVLVTARHESLAEPTRKWVERHFPFLKGVELNMRPEGDLMSSLDSKRGRIAKLKRKYRPEVTLIIDDDPTMSKLTRVFSKTVFAQVINVNWGSIGMFTVSGR
jgi:hypothetical protein